MNKKKVLFLMSRYGFFFIIIFLLIILLIIITLNNKAQINRIGKLENEIQKQFDNQTDILLDTWQAIAMTAAETVIQEIENSSKATDSLFAVADSRNRRFDSMYSNLLNQLEKTSTENQPDRLYTQSVLIELEKEAASLFKDGKYAQSLVLYETVSEVQPENAQARFYYLYSMFLNNRLDRANYPQIKEGLLTLERHGYLRSEITEILEFISLEERGFEAEQLW